MQIGLSGRDAPLRLLLAGQRGSFIQDSSTRKSNDELFFDLVFQIVEKPDSRWNMRLSGS